MALTVVGYDIIQINKVVIGTLISAVVIQIEIELVDRISDWKR